MQKIPEKVLVICPHCSANNPFETEKVIQILYCSNCGTKFLAVMEFNPRITVYEMVQTQNVSADSLVEVKNV